MPKVARTIQNWFKVNDPTGNKVNARDTINTEPKMCITSLKSSLKFNS